jgi:hypothetical protein
MKFHGLTIVAGVIALSACSSELAIIAADVPQQVSAAFAAKYPDAKNVEWEAEKDGGRLYFEAEFESGGSKKEAHFTPDGNFVKED